MDMRPLVSGSDRPRRPVRLGITLSLCVVLAAACAQRRDDVDVAAAFALLKEPPRLPTFRFPASVTELSRRLATARRTEYGLTDTLGGVVWEYFGDRGPSSEPVRESAEVRLMTATWFLPSDDSASVIWRSIREEFDAGLAQGARCFVGVGPLDEGRRIARWTLGAAILSARQIGSDSVPTMGEWRPLQARVVVAVVMDSARMGPVMAGMRPADGCVMGGT